MTLRQAQGEREVRQFTVGADDDDIRLDRWFKRHLPEIGFATISRWARTGQIRVDGKRADPADRLASGQVLRVPPGNLALAAGAGGKAPRARKPLSPEDLALAESMLLLKTPTALVLNKAPGLATQGGSGTFQHVDGLLDAYAPEGPRPRLVHRLDKDTSGVLLIARTPGSAAFFSKRFSGRSARKIYWALITGVPSIEDGLIELPLGKQPGTGGEKMMVDESEQGQTARTRYRVLDRAGNRCAWVELQPLTGRTHQLRVHCAAIGCPILGDGKYGGKDSFLTGTISRKMHLHARRLRVDSPDGGRVDVTAELPPHFTDTLANLGFSIEDGDALPLEEPKFSDTAEGKKRAESQKAKAARKERKGERRGRAVANGERPAAKSKGTGRGTGKTTRSPARGKPSGPARPKRK